jgi:DNA-binding response OmpR family regulator
MPVVLIVEDNRITRAMYAAGLSGYGFEVAEARGLGQAKSYLQTGTMPKVVVLDLNLHDGNGSELVQYIREELKRDDVKIVVTTGSPIDSWKLFELGADVFVNKPIDLARLIGMIREVSNA